MNNEELNRIYLTFTKKISILSTPSWGTEVLIYAFSDERVTFPGAIEEYNSMITPDHLKEYPILQDLIDETFILTKLRKNLVLKKWGRI